MHSMKNDHPISPNSPATPEVSNDQARLLRYRLPLAPAVMVRGRTLTERRGLLLVLDDGKGHCGIGEIAPLPGFSHETLDDATTEALKVVQLWRKHGALPPQPWLPSVRFGIDSALAPLPPDYTLPQPPAQLLLQGDQASVLEQWLAVAEQQPQVAKLKVGRQAIDDELALLRELHQLAPLLRLRLDANGAWNMAQALYFCEHAPVEAIDYIEEPLADARQLAGFYQRSGVGYALDESLLELDLSRPAPPGLRALVIKPTLVGSEQQIRTLHEWATRQQIALVFSAAYESDIGLSHIRRLAALYSPGQPAGLDTARFVGANLMRSTWPDAEQLEWQYLETLA